MAFKETQIATNSRKLMVLALVMFGTFRLHAQHITDIPLMTKTWELIADKTYKQNQKKQWVPSFPASLKALENKTVELPGYMIPVKAGMTHSMFMFSVVPSEQCPFCGQGDIPSMVEVHAAKAVKYTDKPVKIRGRLVLNESGDYRSELFLMNASLVE